MEELNQFIIKIKDFTNFKSTKQIDIFVYYLIQIKQQEGVNAKDIKECFLYLNLKPYSNINAYLNNSIKKNKSAKPKYIKKGSKFYLEASTLQDVKEIIGATIDYTPTDSLITFEIFNNTRGYLLNMAKEAACCYDMGQYNACLVMLRKLIETLIIELFEKNNIENIIRDNNGDYFQLKTLIELLLVQSNWSISKNVKKSIPEIKKLGDLAAHNRRFFAKKPDLDKIKTDLRITIQELITLIDY
ncbi:DUF4145 domain-containing protein [Treponema denticola]|uniref:DUF4145 domain-containing protein n=1 Tax=Treponema denticola TaxID=158 RepID=UPI0002B5F696|nr:DUF4145 domain-containing protein [Treponema denticola]EMB47282.1 hypothetical protein HMPREF9729_01016 [Treponema denticola ASLM]EMD57950.1 hypothetical protein HMPREF9728_00193 [Treponema denticola US-Trep]